MEQILLEILCRESELSEEYLMSNLRDDKIQNNLSMVTYILVTRYLKTVAEVHDFYVSRGYAKTRPTLYGHISRAQKNMTRGESYRSLYGYLINELDYELVHRSKAPTKKSLHILRSKILEHLYKIEDYNALLSIKKQVDLINLNS